MRELAGQSPQQRAPQGRPTLRGLLSRERPFWRLVYVIFFAFAVLKGLHLPNDWALTQAQLDYTHGFIKRGLRGAVFSLFHIHHQHALTAVFFVELLATFALLALLARQSGIEERFGSLAPVIVFSSSFAITYLVHIVGYTDVPLSAMLIALLLVRSPGRRFASAVVVVPLALLIHESFLLMFLPVLLFSFLLDAWLTSDRAKQRRTFLYLGLLVLLALAINFATSLRANLTPGEIDRYSDEIAARVDFDLRDDFFNVLSRPLSGSFRETWAGWHYKVWVVPNLASVADLLPVVALLLYFVRRLIRVTLPHDPALQQRLWFAVLGAVLAPLGMQLLGVDGPRWNTVCALAALLVLLTLARKLPAGEYVLSAAERNAIVLVLAINMVAGGGLFDATPPHSYPFFQDLFVHPVP